MQPRSAWHSLACCSFLCGVVKVALMLQTRRLACVLQYKWATARHSLLCRVLHGERGVTIYHTHTFANCMH